VRGLAVVLLLLACDRPRPAPAPPRSHPPVAVTPPPAAPPPAAPPPAAPAPTTPAAEPAEEGDLQAEERDSNPRSETVKVKLIVTPAAKGTVHWGRKKLADLQPGRMVVETQRPRDSGPLDLVIRTDGFLPHHVRVFTDRDDKLSVRLVRPTEAPSMLGYRRAPAAVPTP
jgi:hypothetical protein